MEGDTALRTRWHALPELHVSVEAPEEMSLVQGDPKARDGESKLVQRIRDALEDRLEALPAFALQR